MKNKTYSSVPNLRASSGAKPDFSRHHLDERQLRFGDQILHFANFLHRWKALIITVTALGTFLIGITVFAIEPNYTAVAQVIIERPESSRGATWIPDPLIETHVTMLNSYGVLTHVRDHLAAIPEPDFSGAAAEPTTASRTAIDGLRHRLLSTVKWLKREFSPAPSPAPSPENPNKVSGAQVPSLGELKKSLQVYQERGSHIIVIRYTDKSAERAAIIANKIVESHSEYLREQQRASAKREMAWLDRRLPEVGDDLERAEHAVRQFQIAHGVNAPDAADLELIDKTRRRIEIARLEADRRQARLDRLRDTQRSGAGKERVADLLAAVTSNVVRNGSALGNVVRDRLARVDSGATQVDLSVNPRSRPNAVEDSQSQLRDSEAQEIERRLEHEIQLFRSQAKELDEHIKFLQSAVGKASEKQMELQALERRAAFTLELLTGLRQSQQHAIKRFNFPVIDARIVARAQPPKRPSSLNPIFVIPAAMFAFSLFGVGVALALESLDRRMWSEKDASEALGISCIGLLPGSFNRRELHRDLIKAPYCERSQSIRSVVIRALQVGGAHRGSKVIFMTSASLDEGTTMLSESFAMCAAELGKRVLLVDLAFPHPGVRNKDQRSKHPNVSEMLLQEGPNAEIIQPAVPDLAYDHLRARELGLDPFALLAGRRLPEIFQRLRDNYDCVVIDGPPVSALAEAILLASMADETIFAVRWGTTTREKAKKALQLLQPTKRFDGDALINIDAVLTQVNLRRLARQPN